MPDALASRLKIGVITPATNTIVQPELDSMRPPGVTNQLTRVLIPDTPVGTDDEFSRMMSDVRGAVEAAVDSVMASAPNTIVMAMTAETFWEGALDGPALQSHLESRAHVKVVLGSQACQAAIQRYGGIRRIAGRAAPLIDLSGSKPSFRASPRSHHTSTAPRRAPRGRTRVIRP